MVDTWGQDEHPQMKSLAKKDESGGSVPDDDKTKAINIRGGQEQGVTCSERCQYHTTRMEKPT